MFSFHDLMSGVDARKIIGPLMSPFMDMFDVMQRNVKARAYADKCLASAVSTTPARIVIRVKLIISPKFLLNAYFQVAQEREDSPLSSSRSIFEMIERLNRPTTTTTPQPPLLERLIRPYLEPWQKQFNDLQKDVAGILPATTTTSPKITTTTRENLFAKSLQLFFPSVQDEKPLATTTPTPPKLFDASMIEKLFFSRQKRDIHTRQKRQEDVRSPSSGLFNPFENLEKPVLEFSNPFTPNPL
ncbi:unnamed protein product, partial [Cylicostephanus goldi]